MIRGPVTGPQYPLGPALDVLRRLWRLDHSLARLSSRMEKSLGITAQQRLVLRCVGKFPGITAGQLASVLHIDPGTMSSTLGRLERKKLLRRRYDPRDGRRVFLGLTPQGRALDIPTTGTAECAVEVLLGRTNAADLASFEAVLTALTELLDGQLIE